MSGIGIIVIIAVGAFGVWLYASMVAENRRTRPARVRQALEDRLRAGECDEATVQRILAVHDKRTAERDARRGRKPE